MGSEVGGEEDAEEGPELDTEEDPELDTEEEPEEAPEEGIVERLEADLGPSSSSLDSKLRLFIENIISFLFFKYISCNSKARFIAWMKSSFEPKTPGRFARKFLSSLTRFS